MRRAPLAAAALLAAVAAFAAGPAKPEPRMHTDFIGEGGGYKPADKTTEGILVGDMPAPPDGAAPADPQGLAAPAAPAAPRPSALPVAASPGPDVAAAAASAADRPGPAPSASAGPSSAPAPAARSVSPRIAAPGRSIAARPAASGRGAPARGDAKPSARESLWNGLVQPLEMTAASAAASNDPDSARANADRDYETHILGGKGGPERAPLGAPSAPGGASPVGAGTSVASGRASGGKVFVSLAIDPREAGDLRDAVAGLGSAAGFSADSRFEAMPGPNGTVLFSGWLPAGRLGDAMSRPGVKSLRVETRERPSNPAETSGEFLIGLRVEDAARAREGVDSGVSALKSAAGFRLTRVVGLETAPDGRAVAVVSGFLPLSKLSRAMGLSEVAKILPVGGEVPAPAAPASAPDAGGLSGFAKFAVERGPWLIILTLLLLLPSLRAPARRVASIFNPYR